jgi:antitoxin (DNA-binding transcriptional repressor) of toxin-antitoxin stability system
MKIESLAHVKNQFPKVIDELTKEPLFITRNGRIVAVLQSMHEQDVEDYLLQHSPRFWKLIDQRRRTAGKGQAAAFDEASYT